MPALTANRTMPDSDDSDLSGLQRRILFTNDQQERQKLQQRMYNNTLRAAKKEYGREGVEQQKQLWQVAANGLQTGYRRGALGPIAANAQRLDYDEWEDRDDLQVTEARLAKTAVEDLLDAGFDRDVSPGFNPGLGFRSVATQCRPREYHRSREFQSRSGFSVRRDGRSS